MVTGKPTVVSFSAHNLKAVVANLRERYPDNPIYICADHDRSKNIGFERAKEAATEHNDVRVILPKFPQDDTRSTDFNDVHVRDGLNTVRQRIQQRLTQDAQKADSIQSQPAEVQASIMQRFDETVRLEGLPAIPEMKMQTTKEYER